MRIIRKVALEQRIERTSTTGVLVEDAGSLPLHKRHIGLTCMSESTLSEFRWYRGAYTLRPIEDGGFFILN